MIFLSEDDVNNCLSVLEIKYAGFTAIDKEEARELVACLERQFINQKYERVHKLITELQKWINE